VLLIFALLFTLSNSANAIDGNGVVDFADFFLWVDVFGKSGELNGVCADPFADVNCDVVLISVISFYSQASSAVRVIFLHPVMTYRLTKKALATKKRR
jgi:hypothetical protein